MTKTHKVRLAAAIVGLFCLMIGRAVSAGQFNFDAAKIRVKALTVTSSITLPSPVAGGVAYSGASQLAMSAAGTQYAPLLSGGSAAPAFAGYTLPSAIPSTGKILRSDGTNFAASTATYPNTLAAGDIPVATSANVLGVITAPATGQVLISSGTGTAPAFSTNPTVTKITVGAGGLVMTASSPAPTATDACTAGTFKVHASGIYFCVASGDVRVAALATPAP